jgi:GTP-binding protein LepA
MHISQKNIRNFSIIAHIDHGKSTLADRLLELTNTVETRKMKDQVLDNMELERERGITIKMQPVRMHYVHTNEQYILNLIDTPGHIDFSYEVSRALRAVEGSLLLVDATQGVQAQTLTTLGMARDIGLTIIPVLTKIDSPLARVEEIKDEVIKLLSCDREDILAVSGKTGEGVKELLERVITHIPAPKVLEVGDKDSRGLVFDFKYSNHKGIVVFIRTVDGVFKKGDKLRFKASGEVFTALETGIFAPDEQPKDELLAGEIGYIVTGIKKPGISSVGDTIVFEKSNGLAIAGYMKPVPVVWASLYPESQDDFDDLRLSIQKLSLSDSAFSYEEETSGALGRGYRVGLLGMLHLEIITERLHREFDLDLIITSPSITYRVVLKNDKEVIVYSPHVFPNDGDIKEVYEPWVHIKIITPLDYLSPLMQLFYEHEGEVIDIENFGENRGEILVYMPLRELMRNFFDELKSVSSGYASISYTIAPEKIADVTRMDVLVADEVVPAFSRVIARRRADIEAEEAVEKLFKILPRQMFTCKIQGKALGRIIASKTLQAFRKDVTGYLYGGDITRKMKLLEKQKKGKKKMRETGKVNIPQDVFLKMMKSGD